MAKRSFDVVTWTPTAQADGVLTGSFQAIVGGAATAIIQIMEIYEGGQAGASSVNAMTLARSSTLGITPTALASPNSSGYMNSNTQVQTTVETAYVAATTAPNRSPATTVARLGLSFNSFGGIVRWVAAPGEEWTQNGNATTSSSESVLSAQNLGTAGAMGSMMIFEIL
jgi:hypothetical protein